MKEENLSALGWYVDPAQFAESGNLYQWIVELHSFDLSLPLAEDMIKAKLSSVVLEFRFHNTYPMGEYSILHTCVFLPLTH
jgi:ubiquitin-conjugating enzyme E2 Q